MCDIPIYKLKKNNKKILVLSGGGMRGLAHIGVLKALNDLNYLDNFEVFAGSSIGSLMIGLHILGYTPDDIWKFIKKFDLGKIRNINIINIFNKFGIDDGSNIEYVIKRLIKEKNHNENITLKEIYDITKKKIIFTTVCINKQNICYLSHETHPDMPLFLAIRMSISIPLFYTPVIYKDMYYVDGGCIDNYPIHIFEDKLDDVLGIYLTGSNKYVNKIENLEKYLFLITQSIMKGFVFCSKRGYEKYTINIEIDANVVDFDISHEKKKYIVDLGYNAVMNKYLN